ASGERETGGDYVKFSKEKYILDSSPEKLHKELEEELKLSSTDLRSHAWYHGRIPRELFEQESFDHVPALVRYHVGSRKAVSAQSGAVIYCPVNRTFPLRYLEASYGLGPSGPKGGHAKRRSATVADGLTETQEPEKPYPLGLNEAVWEGNAGSLLRSTSLPRPRDAIRSCALSMDQIPELHSPVSPISESPSSPAYSTVTRVHAAPAAPSATALPASPGACHSSEPQLCSGSAPKPPGESDKVPHASPSHTLCKASPSPSLSSYSDPDSGHYCQLQPPVHGSREWAAAEASSRQTKSCAEKLKELSENGAPEGDGGQAFTVPVVEATSSFNPATFQSLLIPKDNRPLEVGLLRKVKELLTEVDARTLARHVTKVDCLVARILGVTKEMQTLMGVRWGMELLTLPHGRQLRLDLLERFHTMSIMLAVDILGCTGSAKERAALLAGRPSVGLSGRAPRFLGMAVSQRFVRFQAALISRLEQTWVTLRQRHTEGAILYEKKLKPFLKSLNEGKVAHHGGRYHTNAEAKLQGFQARPELLEVFSTEFQMRLLWGSQGASSSQAQRYEKFDKVLTALSHKLEPAVRSSEL
ncbi:SH2 domain-containing protein 3C, partial [Carlito syrichta]|uniref:SH2 domain-containing protein 3C n=1 Tax=Carlito syrichta TaxID=1868482 RepID=A0A3Q0DSR0_CARSF